MGYHLRLRIHTSRKMEQEKRKRMRMAEMCNEKVSSGHDTFSELKHLRQLCIYAQDWTPKHFIINGGESHEAPSLKTY